jgi:hypothetical protein
MLSKIDTVLKRVVKNKQQVLCLSIIIVLTILISLHLIPSYCIKHINTLPVRLLFIICIGVSLYYNSYMFVLVCIVSLFLIMSQSKQCDKLKGFSDNSIFSYTNQVQEFMENKKNDTLTTEPSNPTTKPSNPTTKPSNPTTKPSNPTTKPSNPTSSSDFYSDVKPEVINKFKTSLLQSMHQIQDNTFLEKDKQDNVTSPNVGVGEYCTQGTIEDGPLAFDPNCLASCSKV